MKGLWWKLTSLALILYSLIGGLLFEVPALPILNESIRNLYFHVPMWFTMTIILSYGFFCCIMYLAIGTEKWDLSAVESNNIFAYPIMIALIFILPRMTDSLHPGNDGNPGFLLTCSQGLLIISRKEVFGIGL